MTKNDYIMLVVFIQAQTDKLIATSRTTNRQATGPPRSGAGVGVGIFRGVAVSWKSQRLKKMISQNAEITQQSTPIQIYGNDHYFQQYV